MGKLQAPAVRPEEITASMYIPGRGVTMRMRWLATLPGLNYFGRMTPA